MARLKSNDMINYEALAKRRWTEFLRSLEPGEVTFSLEENACIDSLITCASRLNTHGIHENTFKVSADFTKTKVTITTTPRTCSTHI